MPFERNVFINCPFDNGYFPILKTILFTLIYFDFEPLISETTDSGSARIAKIQSLINKAKYSIHDISRIQLNENNYPRFNMPFECGIDFGAKLNGRGKLKEKIFLILETERFRYQQFLSDISGNDIRAHKDDAELALKNVRDWLNLNTQVKLQRHSEVWLVFKEFESDYNDIISSEGYNPNDISELSFTDIIEFMKDWIENWKASR